MQHSILKYVCFLPWLAKSQITDKLEIYIMQPCLYLYFLLFSLLMPKPLKIELFESGMGTVVVQDHNSLITVTVVDGQQSGQDRLRHLV